LADAFAIVEASAPRVLDSPYPPMGNLAAATHQVASIEDHDALLAAIPRLALLVVEGSAAQLVRAGDDGSLETLAASGAAPSLRGSALADRLRAQSRPEAIAIVPLGPDEDRLALVVERNSPHAGFGERGLEQLTIFASFAAVSLVRASARAALREAASCNAATLAAIGDGIVVTDRAGIVRAMNPTAAGMLGIAQEIAVGRKLRDLPGLSPLAFALSGVPCANEMVPVPRGQVVVRAHKYEGGIVSILRDFGTEQTTARRAVGSHARFTFEHLIGEDPAFRDAVALARRAALSDLPVLVTGESGTGKELLAQAIHNASGRSAGPFVGVNVTAIPRELVESELFGYEGGTFTGARAGGRAGKFELAGRGTLLLDEIGDMPPEIQGKLLRVLQEKMVQRLGSAADVPVRARMIATTHRDLDDAVANGRFRLDLYHRLRVVHLRIPPLRQRRGDIRLIAEHQLREHAERTGRAPIRLSPTVAAAFEAYGWPGNVRELANVIESEASLLPPDEDVLSQIPQSLLPGSAPRSTGALFADRILPLEELERRACDEALQRCSGSVARAAEALGVAKNTLYTKMRRYGLGRPARKPGSATD
jgi:transcriptional regulator with PAS, ATPase and Fis domain